MPPSDESLGQGLLPCLIWQGRTNHAGYGVFSGNLGIVVERRAHRRAWVFAYGQIPLGMCVLHHCDNPPCVEPTHLFLGTQRDNVMDCMAKGRHRNILSEFNAMKMTCSHGHQFTPVNTHIERQYRSRRGTSRRCRTCARLNKARSRMENPEHHRECQRRRRANRKALA